MVIIDKESSASLSISGMPIVTLSSSVVIFGIDFRLVSDFDIYRTAGFR
jgi:hypothetical protein